MKHRYLVVTMALCSIPLLITSSCSTEADRFEDIYVLIDLSASYLSDRTNDRMGKNLERVKSEIVNLGKQTDTMDVHFLAIGDKSFAKRPIDEFQYRWVMLGNIYTKKGFITNEDDLQLRLTAIKDLILHKRPEQFTDISGALALAAAETRNQMKGPRLMIILSDFKEDLNGYQPMQYDINGFRVAMVYRPLPSDITHPSSLPRRIREWKQRLCESGAQSVMEDIEPGHYEALLTEGNCSHE